ncbi:hypothetical protein AS032_16750 [Rhodococcus qingshengii]|nr:hypothetical protein AS032_16750 [Rhodococcus qingshengii]SCC43555.1 hypothetical protein GA0061093_108256 [Rhodococcus qingshengii]
MIHRRRLALTIPIAAAGGSEQTPMDTRFRVFNASPISQTSGEISMDDNESGRSDLAALVSGIERDDTSGVKAMLGGLSPEELTRLDLAAATSQGECLDAFLKHLNTHQMVEILVGLERAERLSQGGN